MPGEWGVGGTPGSVLGAGRAGPGCGPAHLSPHLPESTLLLLVEVWNPACPQSPPSSEACRGTPSLPCLQGLVACLELLPDLISCGTGGFSLFLTESRPRIPWAPHLAGPGVSPSHARDLQVPLGL